MICADEGAPCGTIMAVPLRFYSGSLNRANTVYVDGGCWGAWCPCMVVMRRGVHAQMQTWQFRGSPALCFEPVDSWMSVFQQREGLLALECRFA